MNMEIKRCPHPQSTADIPVLLGREGVEWLPMNAHNWADRFPYKPMVRFRMAHCGDAVLLHFHVEERCIRALAERNNGKTWEDSCCELFFQPEGEDLYYNIECNCTGSLLIGCGKERPHRDQLSSPHYLSWQPVDTPSPDFHQPRFFGECHFE